MKKTNVIRISRFLAIILAAITLISAVPVSAYAAEITDSIDVIEDISEEIDKENGELGAEEDTVVAEDDATTEADEKSASSEVADDGELCEEIIDEEIIDEEIVSEDFICEEKTSYVDIPNALYQCGSFDVSSSFTGESLIHVNATQLEGARTALYNGLKAKKATIDISQYNITTSQVADLYYGTVNEHPELYYVVTGFGYSYMTYVTTISPKYLTGFNDELFQDALAKALSVVKPGMTDLEKAIALHDYIATNTTYDWGVSHGGKGSGNLWNTYGVLVDQNAVCQGYALTYKMLLNMVGITAHYVSSDSMNHGWDIVKLDGEYYYVDVTWDDPVDDLIGRCRHSYMFVSEKAFRTKNNTRNAHTGSDWVMYVDGIKKNVSATSTKFDNAVWTNINTNMVKVDDTSWVALLADSDGEWMYYIEDIADANSYQSWSYLIEIGKWGNYNAIFSGLFKYENYLYYNRKDGIYRFDINDIYEDIDEFTDEKMYSYNNLCGMAYVYNAKEGLDQVLIEVRSNPNNDGNTYYVELEQLGMKQSLTEYIITYVTNGGVLPEGAKESYTKQDDFDLPVLDDKNGYSFGGWYTTSNFTGSPVTHISEGTKGAKTFYAKWNAKVPGAITFSSDEPLLQLDDEHSCTTSGAKIELGVEGDDADIKIYYTINGTVPTNRSTLYKAPFAITKNTIVKAIAYRGSLKGPVSTNYIEIATCNFVLKDETKTVYRKDNFELEILEMPSGCSEDDITWSSEDESIIKVEEDGSLTALNNGKATITGMAPDWLDRPVYAECEITVIPAIHTVTFKGFNGIVLSTIVVDEFTAATEPAISEKVLGYSFVGWDKDFSYITENIEVNAVYNLNTYTIAYETYGGTLPEDAYVEYNYLTDDFCLVKPSKLDYEFAGWYDNSDFTGSPVSEITKGSIGNKTFYAKWIDEEKLWMKWKDTDSEILVTTYTGKAIKPEFTVYYGKKELTLGKDYSVTYKNNINVNANDDPVKDAYITITGRGNYIGQISKKFIIEPKNITLNDNNVSDVDVAAVTLAYNKKIQKRTPVVSWNGKNLLAKDLDFYFIDETEGAYTEPGKYQVLIKGKGNYTGTREGYVQIIDPKSEAAPVLFSRCRVKIVPFTYSGNVVDFEHNENDLSHITVTDGRETLILGTHYELIYGEEYNGVPCKEIGTYTIVVRGKGKYNGETRVKFNIIGSNITTAKVAPIDAYTFDNTDKMPVLNLTDRYGESLVLDKDYVVSYDLNRNAGTGKAIISGIGKYFGKVTKTFRINQLSVDGLNDDAIIVTFPNGNDEVPYEKAGAKPKVSVQYNNGREALSLTEGTDYVVAYRYNTSVIPVNGRQPELTITFRRNLKGKTTVNYKIKKADISKLSISVPDIVENITAGRYMSVPSITDINGKKLVKNTDYDVNIIYKDIAGNILNKSSKPVAGDIINVYVTGKNNYEGVISGSYRVFAKGMTVATAKVVVKTESAAKLIYTGQPVTLNQNDLTVTVGKTVLTKADYKIVDSTYINNINKGVAKVTIEGRGQYAGTKTISFTVKPQPVSWWKKIFD